MAVLRAIIIAFSTYSVIPMPMVRWESEDTGPSSEMGSDGGPVPAGGHNGGMRFVMCAFPLVGAVIGVLLWLFHLLCVRLSLPGFLRAAGLCLIPVWISGGIHLDGYIDTCDALASHRDREGKLAILKDPHIGAFAAIRLVCLLMGELALWYAYPAERFAPLSVILIFIFSRCLSGLSVLTFPIVEGSGMAAVFAGTQRGRENAEERDRRYSGFSAGLRQKDRAVWLQAGECALAGLLLCLNGISGVLCTITGVIIYVYYQRLSQKEFGGLNGDQAGWFLTLTEAWMLAVVTICSLWIG